MVLELLEGGSRRRARKVRVKPPGRGNRSRSNLGILGQVGLLRLNVCGYKDWDLWDYGKETECAGRKEKEKKKKKIKMERICHDTSKIGILG